MSDVKPSMLRMLFGAPVPDSEAAVPAESEEVPPYPEEATRAATMEWAEDHARVGPKPCYQRWYEKVTDRIEWEREHPCESCLGLSLFLISCSGMTVALTVFYIVGFVGIFEWARDASSGKGSCPPGVWIYTVATLILVGANGFCYSLAIECDAPLRIGNEWAFSIRGVIQFCFSFTLAIWGSVAMSQVDDSHIAAMNCSNEYLADRWNCEPGETQIFVNCKDLPLFTFTQVVTYFYFAVLVLLCCASAPPSYRGCGER